MNKEDIRQIMRIILARAEKRRPLVPSVTNYVTAGFVADCQIAAGASAAMVNMPDEACSLAQKCEAFYINLGTILPVYEQTVPAAAKKLCAAGKPWVLDPVAAGLGGLRSKLLLELKEYKPAVIRGNASEIIALARLWKVADGVLSECTVDSSAAAADAAASAVRLAQYTGGAVAVSGETDYVTDGNVTAVSFGGSILMERAAGFGCALGGVAAYCLALAPENPFVATLCAVNAFNYAGIAAGKKYSAAGSFKTEFVDILCKLKIDDIVYNSFDLRS